MRGSKKSLWFSRPVLGLTSVLALSSISLLRADTKNFNFDIESQTAGTALMLLGEQAGVQILVPRDLGDSLKTPQINGQYTLSQALDTLLKNSGLVYEYLSEHTVVVKNDLSDGPVKTNKERSAKQNNEIEEMVVTATRREESIQDLSMSISAIGRDEISRRGLVGMEDYLSALPGASVMDQGPGRVSVVIRGVSANPQAENNEGAFAGVYFGEVPVAGNGRGGNAADIKLVDIERIEVLRGPQGTLYGSSNMTGTVRNIPVAPDLTEVGGSVNLDYSDTGGFGSDNSKMEAVFNLPLVENVFAVRAVAYKHNTSGFIKNIAAEDPVLLASVDSYGGFALNRDDIGANDITGGRITALWQPTEKLSISMMHLVQDTEQNGWAQGDLELGDFVQSRMQLRRATNPTDPVVTDPIFDEHHTDDLEISNLVIEYDLGWASLLSSTSKLSEEFIYMRDGGLFFNPYGSWSQPNNGNSDLFVQEIRLASQLEGPFQFVGGYYYEDSERYTENWGVHNGDPALNPFGAGELINLNGPHRTYLLKQHAIFGELSYELTEKFKVTAGARLYDFDKINKDARYAATLSLDTSSLVTGGGRDTNYKLGIDYAPNEDTLIYGSWSEGFRFGRPVAANFSPACDMDGDGFYDGSNGVSTGERTIDDDYVENFELGGKFTLLDNRLQINAAAYRINWDGLPVIVIFDTCGAIINAGTAESTGLEFEANYQVSENLLATFSSSYVNAELTTTSSIGNDGDRLPGSPKYNYSIGLQYDFNLSGYDAFLRGDYSYVGGFYGNLQQAGAEIADYGKLNLRSGVFINNLNVNLYINNLTNEKALTWIDSELAGFNQRGYFLRPRTIGFNVGYTF